MNKKEMAILGFIILVFGYLYIRFWIIWAATLILAGLMLLSLLGDKSRRLPWLPSLLCFSGAGGIIWLWFR